MNRFNHLLNNTETSVITIDSTDGDTPKIIGLFPFNALINPETTNPHAGKIDFLPSAITALKKLAEKNYQCILFLNQIKTKPLGYEEFMAMNQALEKWISSLGIRIVGLYWCPVTDKNDAFVTPNPGMFTRATENQKISWKGVPVISSIDTDLIAAAKVGATPIKIGNKPSKWMHFPNFLDWVETL